MGLDYIRYKHKSLPLIAEQEEGDDFFFVCVSNESNISENELFMSILVEGQPGTSLQDNTFGSFMKLNISEIGFSQYNSKIVKECNEKTEPYTK